MSDSEEKTEKMAPAAEKSQIKLLIGIFVGLPVFLFLMSEFLILPRLEKTLRAAQKSAERKSEKASYPGQIPETATMQSADFNDILANLSGALKNRYISISFTIAGSHPNFTEMVEANRVKLIDATLSYLNTLQFNELEDRGASILLREPLLNVFETTLGFRLAEQIFFSKCIIQ